MARIPAVEAEKIRSEVRRLRSSGLSIREIASRLGFRSPNSVQRYLSSTPSVPAAALPGAVRALELKATTHQASGPSQLKAIAEAEGLQTPSETTLGRLIAAAGLAQKGVSRLAIRQPYWVDARPSRALDVIQIDTVKLRTNDGILHELLSARDVVSGATIVLRHRGSQAGMVENMAKIFAVLGVPQVVQSDNGTTDFSLPRRSRLRPWHRFAFSCGVKRIQYIPEAEPQRNGAIESFHNWLQTQWSSDCARISSADLDQWLIEKLNFYNNIKPLLGLGGKAARKTPAAVLGHRVDMSVPPLDTTSFDAGASGIISFVRRGLHAQVAVVKAPALVVALPAELEGHYIRIDLDIDTGKGWIWARSGRAATDRPQRKRNGRFVDGPNSDQGVLIGTFDMPADGICYPKWDDLSGFSPCRHDDRALLRRWKKILKQRIPSLLPSNCQLVDLGDGSWYVLDQYGDLLWTDESGPEVIEHARELI